MLVGIPIGTCDILSKYGSSDFTGGNLVLFSEI